MARLDQAVRFREASVKKTSWDCVYRLPLRLGLTIALLGLVIPNATAGATVEEVALTTSVNRQSLLEEGAKKEGKLLWYTTLIVNQALKPIKQAFEKKYPYVQVEYHRADSEALAQRMLAEYQAKRYDVDVLDGTSTIVMLKKAGYIQRFSTPQLRDYPARLKEPQGYWAVPNLYFMTLGYNTKLVAANEVPKSLSDLLNPKWKGKMVWNTSGGSGAPVFLGNTLITLGEQKGMAYLKQLTAQNVAKSTASARAVMDMVVAGEYAIGINMFNYHAVISRAAGAPVDWQAIEPVPALVKTLGLAKNAPHPHASMLFIDFLLSKDGQKILQEADYLPAHPDVPAKVADLKAGGGKFSKFNFIAPELLYDKEEKWVELFDKMFFK
jgi:ABC-type Fe3+ transport system substrate-binding protein